MFAWASNKLIVIETVAFGKGAWTGALAAQCALASLSVSSYVTLKRSTSFSLVEGAFFKSISVARICHSLTPAHSSLLGLPNLAALQDEICGTKLHFHTYRQCMIF